MIINMYNILRICRVISNSMNVYMYSSITGTVIGLSFLYFHQKKSFVQKIVCRGSWLIIYILIYKSSESIPVYFQNEYLDNSYIFKSINRKMVYKARYSIPYTISNIVCFVIKEVQAFCKKNKCQYRKHPYLIF